MVEELDSTRVERMSLSEEVGQNREKPKTKWGRFSFLGLLFVAIIFDVLGLFFDEIPVVGAILAFLFNMISIPWYYFSKVPMTSVRASVLAVTTVAESIPLVGNLPLITLGVVMVYIIHNRGIKN